MNPHNLLTSTFSIRAFCGIKQKKCFILPVVIMLLNIPTSKNSGEIDHFDRFSPNSNKNAPFLFNDLSTSRCSNYLYARSLEASFSSSDVVLLSFR